MFDLGEDVFLCVCITIIEPINKAVIYIAPNGDFYLLNFKMYPDMKMEPGGLLNTTMRYLFFLIVSS